MGQLRSGALLLALRTVIRRTPDVSTGKHSRRGNSLSSIKHRAKTLANRLPSPVERVVRRLYVHQRFKTEMELIAGKHQNKNEHPSIIHFSFNKAATQYVKSVLQRCAIENGMVPVAVHDYAFHTNFPRLHYLPAEDVAKYHYIFKQRGYLYSVFEGMIEGIPHLEDYKVVLFARDPRDLLVSGYYSIAYSHTEPSKSGSKYEAFMKRRRRARGLTIDEYVVAESDNVYGQFSRYQRLLLERHPNVHLTTYERMVSDFEGWLKDLVSYCELPLDRSLFESLVRENERLIPNKENIHNHLRKGQPGDYRRKLKAETIEYLDEKFAPILPRFGYHTTVRDVR